MFANLRRWARSQVKPVTKAVRDWGPFVYQAYRAIKDWTG